MKRLIFIDIFQVESGFYLTTHTPRNGLAGKIYALDKKGECVAETIEKLIELVGEKIRATQEDASK